MGRLFGFQAFNETDVQYNTSPDGQAQQPSAKQPVPATILLAADHACTLLGAQFARLVEARYPQGTSNLPEAEMDLLFHQAVLNLHTILFESYVLSWCVISLSTAHAQAYSTHRSINLPHPRQQRGCTSQVYVRSRANGAQITDGIVSLTTY